MAMLERFDIKLKMGMNKHVGEQGEPVAHGKATFLAQAENGGLGFTKVFSYSTANQVNNMRTFASIDFAKWLKEVDRGFGPKTFTATSITLDEAVSHQAMVQLASSVSGLETVSVDVPEGDTFEGMERAAVDKLKAFLGKAFAAYEQWWTQ